MLKNKIILFLLLSLINLGSMSGQVNVRDFGAKGDGKTDDTKSIMEALKYVKSKGVSLNVLPDGRTLNSYVGNQPILYFPAGLYMISASIPLDSYVNIQGEDAIIFGTKNFSGGNNAAFEGSGWQSQISGLQFAGFNIAVKLNSKNIDMGKVHIYNCQFTDNNTAIVIDCQSTLTTIDDCRFLCNNKSIVIKSGDKVIVSKNWITSGTLQQDYDANIINYGSLSFENNLLVPRPVKRGVKEPAWINNYGSVSCESIRQGGEEGSFTLINNFAKANKNYPIIPSSVSVKNSDCYAVYRTDENWQPAVIRLYELPNQIVLEDIRGMVDAQVIGHSYSKISNPSDWARQYSNDQKIIKIRLANIIGGREENTGNVLPAYLRQFAESDNYQLAKTKNSVKEEIGVSKVQKKGQLKSQEQFFEYEFILNDLTANFLVSYSGNPNVNGSGSYNGGLVAILKCNGMYHEGKVSYHISTENIYNNMGEQNDKDRPYRYSVIWKSTGSPYKLVGDNNNVVVLRIENSTGAERINVINLNTL